jgi:transcriptional regulator of arginine metabolism
MTGTVARRRAIRRLIRSRAIDNQSALVEFLKAEGHSVTQATVSRDLDAIGASKVRRKDGVYLYQLAEQPTKDVADRALTRAMRDFVVSIAVSINLVVLRTPPGAANLVGGAIDHAGIDGVLGTVAGDDTVMVICAEERGAKAVARELEQIGTTR